MQILTRPAIAFQKVNKVPLPDDALIYCRVLNFLKRSTHWSCDRTASQIKTCILNSIASYIAFDGVDIVGFGRIVGDRSHVCLLTDIAVHSDYRGHGIATQIIEALLTEAKGCEKVFAHTSQANGLYKRLGFSDFDGGTMQLNSSIRCGYTAIA